MTQGRRRLAQGGGIANRLLARLVLAGALLVAHGHGQAGRADDLKNFVGSYVGQATVEDLATGERQQRDLDIVVVPYHQHGLRIDWITVGLVDGRRDLPGVKRWSQTALFEPAPGDGFLVEVGANNVFQERQTMEPIEGDPVRWTRVDGNVLITCSFLVLEDGRYELQLYQRTLTDIGMDIRFERSIDGQLVRRVTGTAVRAS